MSVQTFALFFSYYYIGSQQSQVAMPRYLSDSEDGHIGTCILVVISVKNKTPPIMGYGYSSY